MSAIEKKSKVKNWKYNFLFVCREDGWGDVPDWNDEKPCKEAIGIPSPEEKVTAEYFRYYVREDDRPRPLPRFMSAQIEAVSGPEIRRARSKGREPYNWLPRLSFFSNDVFLVAAGLLQLKKYSKGTLPFPYVRSFFES